MEVTFAASGALSRAHYSIVRQVESATSVQQADQALAQEIKTVHGRLSRASPTIKECKECLVILLYISSSASAGFLPPGSFDFALAHGLNLAEVGRTIEDKRIGYLFCSELMPPRHELRLMMVNTLRKDLESGRPGRMCLALDNLITLASEDILPAVQDIVLDLISHNYPHIRSRAILALRSLAPYNSTLLSQASEVITKRSHHQGEPIASGGLSLAAELPVSNPAYTRAWHVTSNFATPITVSNQSLLSLRSLQALQRNEGLAEPHLPFALDCVKSLSSSRQRASLLGIFRLLSQHSPEKLIEAEKARDISIVRCLQDLLSSHDTNDQYLYLACLLCVDPGVWAGTLEDRPLVLEGWEVEKIMQFLESPDELIRKMTLNLLAKIDTAILATYLNRIMDGLGPGLDIATLNAWASLMLETVAVLSSEDGESFAQGVKEILKRLGEVLDRPRVLQSAVEKILLQIRASTSDFSSSCVTALLTYLVESGGPLLPGPTFLVIASALSVEYVGSVSVAPEEILKVFCASLKTSTPVVQDALLVAILRLVAECDEAALVSVKQVVEDVQQRAGPHIQKRCSQVLRHISDSPGLRRIVHELGSQTPSSDQLPEFLESLERPKQSQPKRNTSSGYNDTATSSQKLRYAAYEQPQPMPSLRSRRSSSPSGSVRSDATSDKVVERQVSSQESTEAVSLSLAAVSLGLDLRPPASRLKQPNSVLEPISSTDLISLDSPFVTEGTAEEESVSDEFERIWNTLPDGQGGRGWCDGSVEVVLRRLQCLDGMRVRVAPSHMPPFEGELKVILTEGGQGKATAVVRLREGEDESCLWRLKSPDESMRRSAKVAMS
ncbi:hypothetical protein D9611_000102 [Ephemerocybe angulata]|uniref:Clathrin/coatomer adaptor adaptin-like N-terminal domain-containing protein n=1 Tax=Ephemerocybe angulata TaxID=980116 RepID=A0A8H5BM19_9AGAR|nr:hypothetical protein D9611_000102 [Tulosesus angulatus]